MVYKRDYAGHISFFRLFLGSVAAVAIAIPTGPTWLLWLALVLIAVASPTEAIDGEVARRTRDKSHTGKTWWAPNGKQANEIATMPLCIAVPGAVLIRVWLDSSGSVSFAVLWTVLCAFFIGMTLYFNGAKAVLKPIKAERAEVRQALFTGLIVMLSATAVFRLTGDHGVLVILLFIAAVFVVAGITAALAYFGTADRLWCRVDEKPSYKGTRESVF